MKTTRMLATGVDALAISPDQHVSSRSVWRDPVWRLDPERPGAPARGHAVYWPTDVDPDLVNLFKILLWTLYVEPHGRSRVDVDGLAGMTTAVRFLARYMSRFEYVGFDELDAKAVGLLSDTLREQAVASGPRYEDVTDPDAPEDAGEGAWPGDSGSEPAIAFGTVYAVFRLIKAMHSQRHVLARLDVRAPASDPLRGTAPYELARAVRAPNEGAAGALPDEVAIPLMLGTRRIVVGTGDASPARDVLRLQQVHLDAMRGPGGNHTRRSNCYAALRRFEFSTLQGESQAWHPRLPVITDEGEEAPGLTVRNLVVAVRDACILLLLQQVGLRLHEVLSPLGGTDPATGLPECVTTERSESGALDLFYLHGRTKKGRTTGDPERWLLGAVPAGSGYLPDTVVALRMLDDLMRPHRELSGDPVAREALAVSIISPGMPTSPGSVARITAHRAAVSIAGLYASLMDFSVLPNVSRSGDDMTRYRDSRGSNITAVRWRKTFATMTIRIDGGALYALKRHFKHLNIATTESAYVGCDPGLLEDIDDARTQASLRFMRERADGDAAGGRGGRIMDRQSGRIGRLIADERRAREAIETGALRVFDGEHGACAIFLSPASAACHADAGDPSFLHDRPDFSRRSPGLCAGCRNSVIGREHLAYWRERFITNNRAKREQAALGQSAAAVAFGRRAAHAASVLRSARRRIAAGPERRVYGGGS